MKADFPTVARPWQWGTRQSCSTVAQWGGSRDGLGGPCPRAEASSAAPPRALCGQRGWMLSAERCRGQPQSPRAAIRPRVKRGPVQRAEGAGESKEKAEESSLGAPLLPGQLRGSSLSSQAHPACLGCPAPAEEPWLLPGMGKEGV